MQEKIDPTQKIETNAYVPTYKLNPEFKDAVLRAIGKYPFNQIKELLNAIDVEVIDHNTLTNVINSLGNFPYLQIAPILENINCYLEQIVEE